MGNRLEYGTRFRPVGTETDTLLVRLNPSQRNTVKRGKRGEHHRERLRILYTRETKKK